MTQTDNTAVLVLARTGHLIARTAWQAINRQVRAIKDILSKEEISKSINGFKLLMLTAVGISMQESCSRPWSMGT